MGLALDEPKANDEKIEVEGFSFIMASEVVDTIRSYENLFIDYVEHPWTKGFQLSFPGKSSFC
jgi:Fe-S cluster assembly iron-binding protein IscA